MSVISLKQTLRPHLLKVNHGSVVTNMSFLIRLLRLHFDVYHEPFSSIGWLSPFVVPRSIGDTKGDNPLIDRNDRERKDSMCMVCGSRYA